MFNMKSITAVLAAAALVSAQNGTVTSPNNGNGNGTAVDPNNGNGNGNGDTTVNINISIDITFVQTFFQPGPTGLVPVSYTFEQHCPGGCPAPNPTSVPDGFVVTTVPCTVCGPATTEVVVTTCPYANASPTPAPYCPTCHTDVVVYTPVPTCNTCPTPACTTLTHVYPPPVTTQPPTYVVPTQPATTYVVPTPPVTTVVSQCPSCPATTMVYTSTCPGCPATMVPYTTTPPANSAPPAKISSVCPGNCPKSTSGVPTPVPYTTTPPAYTGAGEKLQVGAGLFLAGFVAVFALL